MRAPVEVLELAGGVFEVKATNGDTSLGGEVPPPRSRLVTDSSYSKGPQLRHSHLTQTILQRLIIQ